MTVQPLLPGFELPLVQTTTPEADLDHYPHVDTDVLCARAKEIGLAGEQLVLSKLTRLGQTAFQVADHHPFDLLLLRSDHSLRVQIKTTTRPRDGVYRFAMTRGYRGNPMGVRPYGQGDYDIAALVVLPEDCVLFTAEKRPQHQIPVTSIPHLRAAPALSLMEALADLGLTADGGQLSISGRPGS